MIVGFGEIESQVSEVQHGNTVEFVLPGVDKLLLAFIVALGAFDARCIALGDVGALVFVVASLHGEGEMARGCFGVCGIRLGEVVPFA